MKLKQKIDHFLWAFMWLLPFLSYLVTYWRIGGAVPVLEYIEMHFSFTFVHELLINVWDAAFGDYLYLAGYISYLVAVEIVHCLFDAIVFIPRFAHSLIERSEKLCQGK